jgi:hypothetical protein
MDQRIFICVRNKYVSFRVRCVLDHTFNPYDDVHASSRVVYGYDCGSALAEW